MNTGTQNTRTLWAALVAVIGMGVWTYLWMTAPKGNRGLMRYVRQVTNSVSPHELQRWAVGILNNNDWSATNNAFEINPLGMKTRPDLAAAPIIQRIPTLGHFPAQVCLIEPTKENGYSPSMTLLYLGSHLSWSIHVGNTNYYRVEERNSHEWIPGVYITISP